MVPAHSSRYYYILSFGVEAEGIVLRGWYCCAPIFPSILPYSLVLMVEGTTVVTPHSRLILLYSIVLTVEWRVWSYVSGTVVPPPCIVILLYFLALTAEWTGPVVPHPSL